MITDEEILFKLIDDGTISTELRKIIEEDQVEQSEYATLAVASMIATYRAFLEAKKSNVPFLIQEKDALYEIHPNGEKRYIRKIERTSWEFPQKIKLN